MAGGGKHTRGRGGGDGSPRPGPGGPGGSDPGVEDPCDISFETVLNSVVPLSLQSVSRGNKLKLTVDGKKSPPRLEVTHNGALVGVISHPKTLEVIGCIGEGNEYIAVVLERQANLCKVKVERQA
jgi:hypothetical protein